MLTPFLNNPIRKLDLSHNAFGPIGVPGFDFLIEKLTTLEELTLINDGLGPKGGEMVVDALLKSQNKLKVLSVPRNRLENDGFIAFAKVLAEMKSFESIEFYQNFCKKEGMTALIKSLFVN
jgi:Ran GTPase-activating protein (RanGAP) involved in mRNA processing and transport